VRISVLFAWLCAGPAFAADEVGGIGRMDFAATPAFHSVFETRIPQPVEARRSASVSAKVRIAMWASGSTLPAQPESLLAIQPTALPKVETLQPSETITAKTVQSASLGGSSPKPRSVEHKRLRRRVLVDPSEIEDDRSSFLEYQRRALSNRADLDGEEGTSEDGPAYLGRPEATRHSNSETDAQPALLGSILGALFPQ
jgi:hypothetical protein